jgi:hypothetical protein
MTGCTHVEVAVARGIERGCAADRKEGERNLIGKVVSSGDGGDGCGESPKVEDGNQSRLKWIERGWTRSKGVIHVRLVLLVVFWLVDIFFSRLSSLE